MKTEKGDIVLWMYEPELKVCIVKWGNGMQYFKHVTDVLSVPQLDVRTLEF